MAEINLNPKRNNTSLPDKDRQTYGFSITELIMAVSIIGILSSVAVPQYSNHVCKSESMEAESTIGSVKAITAAYADETGVFPTTWDELSSITAIMTNSGIASGNLSTSITLPSEKYQLTIEGPEDATYEIVSERTDTCEKRNIRACIDLSTGASDLRVGDGNIDAQDPICS